MISVCIASYNGEKYIKEQLSTILSQLDNEDEIVISDDGSTDRTMEIIASFQDSRIRILNHKPALVRKHYNVLNRVSRNFENALLNCRGDIIFLSDQDDVWLPNKVERCLMSLKENDFVISSYKKIDSNGNFLGLPSTIDKRLQMGFWGHLLYGPTFGCAMAMNRRFLDFALPFPNYFPMHDRWLGMLALIMGEFCYIRDELFLYRKHGENNSSKENNGVLRKILIRVYLLFCLFKRKITRKY